MDIRSEIQSLSPTALIELFELDLSGHEDAVMYFHAGTNELMNPIVWQGKMYQALPVEAEGFEITTQGTLPRPKLKVANIQGMFSSAIREYDDLVGCKIIRRRTFARYLDAVNFPDGKNPEADPYQHLPDEIWFIEQKVSENRYIIEWELSSAMDLQGVMLPARQIIQSTCLWRYRGPECGYVSGYYYDKNDRPCTHDKDFCAKRLTSCRLRFGNKELPYGGFPGAIRYDQSY